MRDFTSANAIGNCQLYAHKSGEKNRKISQLSDFQVNLTQSKGKCSCLRNRRLENCDRLPDPETSSLALEYPKIEHKCDQNRVSRSPYTRSRKS
ncbi:MULTISPECIES: hypothetical protein [Kamptonema]|uniref:hypothetical protein n=1 Tax=Kamptonema TaxID=1501433 RepID=UPI0011D2C2C4|nr:MULTISPECIES: hypothetical protein [Kamptonema]